MHDVERTLSLSIVLVIIVVFVFIRNGRATLIPAVAVPVSLIGTFAVMYLCGYSLDNLSLMALTISTGFVVDDAIVVMENITRHLEDGMEPFAAALKGAKEIGFTVLSISISLIAVFIPLLLMGGIVGRLFREFAITLSTAILVSMVISLTTTPMMCAYLLRAQHSQKHGRMYMATERMFERVLSWYRSSLHWVLDNPVLTLTVLFLTVALNVALVIKIPKGFFPQQDTGTLGGGVQGPQDSSFPAMNDSIKRIVDVIKSDPAVQNVIAFTGGGGATNSGNIFIALKPLSESKDYCAGNHQPFAAAVESNACGFGISASVAGSAHRRARQFGALPVHDSIRQCFGPDDVGAAAACRDEETADVAGRELGSTEWRAGCFAELRPGDGGKTWADRAIAQSRNLQRVRAIRSLDYLHAIKSILRGAGSRSEILAVTRRA